MSSVLLEPTSHSPTYNVRLLKKYLAPGIPCPFSFVLAATRFTPRNLLHLHIHAQGHETMQKSTIYTQCVHATPTTTIPYTYKHTYIYHIYYFFYNPSYPSVLYVRVCRSRSRVAGIVFGNFLFSVFCERALVLMRIVR